MEIVTEQLVETKVNEQNTAEPSVEKADGKLDDTTTLCEPNVQSDTVDSSEEKVTESKSLDEKQSSLENDNVKSDQAQSPTKDTQVVEADESSKSPTAEKTIEQENEEPLAEETPASEDTKQETLESKEVSEMVVATAAVALTVSETIAPKVETDEKSQDKDCKQMSIETKVEESKEKSVEKVVEEAEHKNENNLKTEETSEVIPEDDTAEKKSPAAPSGSMVEEAYSQSSKDEKTQEETVDLETRVKESLPLEESHEKPSSAPADQKSDDVDSGCLTLEEKTLVEQKSCESQAVTDTIEKHVSEAKSESPSILDQTANTSKAPEDLPQSSDDLKEDKEVSQTEVSSSLIPEETLKKAEAVETTADVVISDKTIAPEKDDTDLEQKDESKEVETEDKNVVPDNEESSGSQLVQDEDTKEDDDVNKKSAELASPIGEGSKPISAPAGDQVETASTQDTVSATVTHEKDSKVPSDTEHAKHDDATTFNDSKEVDLDNQETKPETQIGDEKPSSPPLSEEKSDKKDVKIDATATKEAESPHDEKTQPLGDDSTGKEQESMDARSLSPSSNKDTKSPVQETKDIIPDSTIGIKMEGVESGVETSDLKSNEDSTQESTTDEKAEATSNEKPTETIEIKEEVAKDTKNEVEKKIEDENDVKNSTTKDETEKTFEESPKSDKADPISDDKEVASSTTATDIKIVESEKQEIKCVVTSSTENLKQSPTTVTDFNVEESVDAKDSSEQAPSDPTPATDEGIFDVKKTSIDSHSKEPETCHSVTKLESTVSQVGSKEKESSDALNNGKVDEELQTVKETSKSPSEEKKENGLNGVDAKNGKQEVETHIESSLVLAGKLEETSKVDENKSDKVESDQEVKGEVEIPSPTVDLESAKTVVAEKVSVVSESEIKESESKELETKVETTESSETAVESTKTVTTETVTLISNGSDVGLKSPESPSADAEFTNSKTDSSKVIVSEAEVVLAAEGKEESGDQPKPSPCESKMDSAKTETSKDEGAVESDKQSPSPDNTDETKVVESDLTLITSESVAKESNGHLMSPTSVDTDSVKKVVETVVVSSTSIGSDEQLKSPVSNDNSSTLVKTEVIETVTVVLSPACDKKDSDSLLGSPVLESAVTETEVKTEADDQITQSAETVLEAVSSSSKMEVDLKSPTTVETDFESTKREVVETVTVVTKTSDGQDDKVMSPVSVEKKLGSVKVVEAVTVATVSSDKAGEASQSSAVVESPIQTESVSCKIVAAEEQLKSPVSEATDASTTKTVIETVTVVTSLPGESIIKDLPDSSDLTESKTTSDESNKEHESSVTANIKEATEAKEETSPKPNADEQDQSSFVPTEGMSTALSPTTPEASALEKNVTLTTEKNDDIITETVTIVKESVDTILKETSGVKSSVETKLVSTSTISESVTESAGAVIASASIGSATFEEITNKGVKLIDESLESVRVHMAKEVELEQTDLASAEAFDTATTVEQCVTQITEKTLDPEGNVIESKVTTVTKTGGKDDTKDAEEKVASWGKPMSLPSPIPPPNHSAEPKQSKERASRSDKNVTPVYMDLAYVPFHGDCHYSDVEFFKRVRARYYVFSGVEPSREVFDALLEGKKTWENKDLGKFSGTFAASFTHATSYRSDNYPHLRFRCPWILGGRERGSFDGEQDRLGPVSQSLHHQFARS